MTKQEIATLKAIAENLRAAATSGWTSGDIHKWSGWAESMKKTCQGSAKLIDSLVDTSDGDENKYSGGLTLD